MIFRTLPLVYSKHGLTSKETFIENMVNTFNKDHNMVLIKNLGILHMICVFRFLVSSKRWSKSPFCPSKFIAINSFKLKKLYFGCLQHKNANTL
jgi:hypothetical protein